LEYAKEHLDEVPLPTGAFEYVDDSLAIDEGWYETQNKNSIFYTKIAFSTIPYKGKLENKR
jgi:hypothetical protein